MTIEVQDLDPEDWDRWYDTLALAFGDFAEAPEERALWHELTAVDRSLVARDGTEVVGTASAFSFHIAVPGNSLAPAAGVSMVSVAATHRRRGTLRELLRRQMDAARERGEALSVLTASEPDIYPRFGYGLAAWRLAATIDTARVRLDPPPGAEAVTLRTAPPQEALEVCESLYARQVPTRPGMLARSPGWDRLQVLDPEGQRRGASPLRCVLAERDGQPRGYARFAVRPGRDDSGSAGGTVLLRDLVALDPATCGVLWRFLFDIDLTCWLQFDNRPVDDPLLHLVSDPRRCRLVVRDGLFLRPVEVGEALAARRYATDVDTVLEVSDPFCPWNEGRWRVSGNPRGAACSRTSDPAELSLSANDLGAVYLGGTTLTALAGAGRVVERRPGALGRASVAFAGAPAPWLSHGF